jgi:hypothetical protein
VDIGDTYRYNQIIGVPEQGLQGFPILYVGRSLMYNEVDVHRRTSEHTGAYFIKELRPHILHQRSKPAYFMHIFDSNQSIWWYT